MSEEVEFISMDEHPSYDTRHTSRQENGKQLIFKCSECKYQAPREQLVRFCPGCGGKISKIRDKNYERSLKIGYNDNLIKW